MRLLKKFVMELLFMIFFNPPNLIIDKKMKDTMDIGLFPRSHKIILSWLTDTFVAQQISDDCMDLLISVFLRKKSVAEQFCNFGSVFQELCEMTRDDRTEKWRNNTKIEKPFAVFYAKLTKKWQKTNRTNCFLLKSKREFWLMPKQSKENEKHWALIIFVRPRNYLIKEQSDDDAEGKFCHT